MKNLILVFLTGTDAMIGLQSSEHSLFISGDGILKPYYPILFQRLHSRIPYIFFNLYSGL